MGRTGSSDCASVERLHLGQRTRPATGHADGVLAPGRHTRIAGQTDPSVQGSVSGAWPKPVSNRRMVSLAAALAVQHPEIADPSRGHRDRPGARGWQAGAEPVEPGSPIRHRSPCEPDAGAPRRRRSSRPAIAGFGVRVDGQDRARRRRRRRRVHQRPPRPRRRSRLRRGRRITDSSGAELRQDPRVVEPRAHQPRRAHDRSRARRRSELVTLDLSYLSVSPGDPRARSGATRARRRAGRAREADVRARDSGALPKHRERLDAAAAAAARRGVENARWRVLARSGVADPRRAWSSRIPAPRPTASRAHPAIR